MPRNIIACLFSLLALSAQAATDETLRVLYFETFPPYSEGKGPDVKGLFVDVLNEALGVRMKVKLTHTGLPWARAQSMVAAGEADALVTLATPERLSYALAGKEVVYAAEMRFYASSQNPQLDTLRGVTTIEAAKPYTIGSYIGNGWVASHMSNYHLDLTPSNEQTLKKLAASRVDLVPGDSDQTRKAIADMGLEKNVVELPAVIDSTRYQLLIRKTSSLTKLMPQIDATLREMRMDGSMAKIYAHYGRKGS